MMEDVVTTGLSVARSDHGDRGRGRQDDRGRGARRPVERRGGFGVPFFPLIRLEVPTYEADALPPELAAIPAIKPGSRAA